MSQTWTENCFQSDHAYNTDMGNVEANLITLRTCFSGASAPGSPDAGQQWFDTTKKLPKVRNQADSAWLAILTGSASQKLWIYRNDSDDGWTIDTSVTDRVLSVKGGSSAYNVSGGNVAGTWTQPDHVHKIWDYRAGYIDRGYNSAGSSFEPTAGTDTAQNGLLLSPATANKLLSNLYTENEATANTWRPAAAVGTLQYPDI